MITQRSFFFFLMLLLIPSLKIGVNVEGKERNMHVNFTTKSVMSVLFVEGAKPTLSEKLK